MPSELRRQTPTVIAIILYYTILGVNEKAVSELIDLKYGVYKVSPKDCLERIDFTRKTDFPAKGRSWDPKGVALEIAEHIKHDHFMQLASIDKECERLLSKHRDVPLAKLKDDQNPCKKATIQRVQQIEFRAKESRDWKRYVEEVPQFVPYLDYNSTLSPPLPHPWKDNAYDDVLGRRSPWHGGS